MRFNPEGFIIKKVAMPALFLRRILVLSIISASLILGSALAQEVLSRPVSFHLDSDEFPIGMYSVDSDDAMAQVAKMGVRYVHTYANGQSATPEGIANDQAYLDMARKHGLKVMFNLHGKKWLKMKGGLKKMMKFVTAFKDDPALGFWYFCDEPNTVYKPAELIPFYRALKKATPHIPVAVAMAWTDSWYKFNDTLDILMVDNYPVQHRQFPKSSLSRVTEFTDSALRLDKPVIPINQCMNWKALSSKSTEYRGSPVSKMRYPTSAEVRFWCFSGVAQGVRGMFWWSYARSVQEGSAWISGDFSEVMREFSAFTKLVSPAHEPLIFKQSSDSKIMMALWERKSVNMLVAVNASPVDQPMRRWTEEGLSKAVLTPWGGTRDNGATIQNGMLKAGTAKPWEAFVWTLTDIKK